MKRRPPPTADPADVIRSLPDDLAVRDQYCLCAYCEPDLPPDEVERLEARWADRERRRRAWLAARGVSPLTEARVQRDMLRGG